MENKFAASDSEVRDSGSLLAPSRLSARVSLSATGAEPAVAGANLGEGAATSAGRSILRPSALSASSCSAVSAAGVSAQAGSSLSQWPPSSSCSSSSSSLSKPDTANTTPSFQLQPPRFRNPFASTSKALEGVPSTDTDSDAGGGGGENGSGESDAIAAPPAGASDNCSSGGALFGAAVSDSDRVTTFSSVANGAKSGSSAPVASAVPAVPVSAGFVFGENLRDRVTNASEPVAKAADGNTDTQCEHDHSSSSDQTPADSGATAPAAAATDTTAANCSATSSSALGSASAKSLLEQSAEQCEREKARVFLHTLEEVPVVTGEENEHNVLHIGCKLYAFEKSSCSYRERGRGQLRLNDRLPEKEDEAAAADGDGAGAAAAAGGGGGGLQSRLVFRVQGSMRLALNAQLWPAMEVQRPSPRDVRVTALDGDQVRVFLLKCSAKDAGQLFDELQWRVRALQESNGGETPTAAAAAAASTAATADDSDSTSDSIKITTTTTNTANTQSSQQQCQQQRDAERESDAEHVATKRRKVDTD